MKQPAYLQHVKTIAKPGKRDELVLRLEQIIEPLKQNPSCIYYLICTTEEPDVVWVTELWESKEAKDTAPTAMANLSPADRERVQKELMPLVASMTEQMAMTVVGGKGL